MSSHESLVGERQAYRLLQVDKYCDRSCVVKEKNLHVRIATLNNVVSVAHNIDH